MKHFFEKLDGWFDYADLYAKMVETHPEGAHFVEVGSWKGKSAAFMAVEILNSGKNIRLDLVDLFTYEFHPVPRPDKVSLFNENYAAIKKNLHRVPWVNIIPKSSAEAAAMYTDGILDFVFIDGNHHYKMVKWDIELWLPKLKPGGILAGHDYGQPSWPGVEKAVKELLPNHQKTSEYCWIYQKPTM